MRLSSKLRRRLVAVARQFPWYCPRGIIRDGEQWLQRREKLLCWYRRIRGDNFLLLYPAVIANFPPPADLPDPAIKAFRQISRLEQPKAGLFYLKNITLFSDNGTVLTGDNLVFDEFSHYWNHLSIGQFLFRKPFQCLDIDPVFVEETVAVLATPECHNYYHWLFDLLPRLHLLESVHQNIQRYAVPQGILPWQLETLQLLGIEEHQLLYLSRGRRVLCGATFVTSLPGSEGCSPPWALKFLRDKFLLTGKTITGLSAKRLYLRRGASSGRPVVNEEALIKRLSMLGFDAVDPGALSFRQQVALFRGANFVVAPHGAALSNLVFSESGTKVLELFSQEYLRPDCYYTLSHLLRLDYRCWVAATPPDGKEPWGAIEPSPDEIEQIINYWDDSKPQRS